MEKTDGRGIIWGGYINNDHPMSRDIWLQEAFPEWGCYLNKEIEKFEVPKGQVSMWWCGGPSWILKTDEGGIFLIDQFSGPSHYTTIDYCGVCRQSGSDSLNWMRLNPQVYDPWGFSKIDAVLCTHAHADHCDIFSILGAHQTCPDCKFIASKVAAKRVRSFHIPDELVVEAEVKKYIDMPGARIHFLPCYDDTAIRTGGGKEFVPYNDACVCFLFETSAGNILFMGDTWYNDAYVKVGKEYKIDVAIFDMGFNPPGATDKMTPYDCARLGKALNPKVMIPDHYDSWASCAGDPDLIINQFERISHEINPDIKTVIMRSGGCFTYPKDQDIGRYRYPDASGTFNISKSAYADL